MQGIINKKIDNWVRPWDEEKPEFKDRDERYFSLLTKAVLEWLTDNMKMYGKPINHFIFNTGSSYLFLENNGYEYNWCETTGENTLYMDTPRCIVTMGNISIPTEELTNPFVRGVYERISNADKTKGQILAYNAEMRRLPIEITYNLKYVFSTFNESIIRCNSSSLLPKSKASSFISCGSFGKNSCSGGSKYLITTLYGAIASYNPSKSFL